jgi:hypothetical protein
MESEGAEIAPSMRTERKFELGLPGMISVASPDPLGFISAIREAAGGNFSDILARDANISARVFASPVSVKVNVLSLLTIELFTGFDMNIALKMDKDTQDAMKNLVEIADFLESNKPPDKGIVSSMNGKHGEAAIGISAFAEIGAGASRSFLKNKLYVRAAPSLYFPVFYARNGSMNFSFSTSGDGLGTKATAAGSADFKILTPFSLAEGVSVGGIFASPGLDMSLEGRYAIWRGLEAGLSINHVPLIPATTKYETSSSGNLKMEASILGLKNDGSTLEFKNSAMVDNILLRPVRFDVFAVVKPFENLFVFIKPNVGISLLNIVDPEIPVNFGIEAGVNLPVALSASIGTHHTDGMWEHAIRAALDLHFVELDQIAGLSGPSFLTNGWTFGKGLKSGF